jgi:hypothetical protein
MPLGRRLLFYADGEKRNQTANTTETKAATQLPKITLLAIRLTFGEAYKAAKAVTNDTSTKTMAIIRKITSYIAVPRRLETDVSVA